MEEKSVSPYYANTGKIPFGGRLSLHIRRKIFEFFIEVYTPGPDASVLDVGVTSDDSSIESNFFEKLYPYPSSITCIGTEDGSHLEAEFRGLKFIQIFPGKTLPFKDLEFDIAFSNAVIEHTGNTEQQRLFVNEVCRVAKKVFFTTPNRWFPFETHSGIPLLHFLPKDIFRKLISGTRFDYWSHEENLNLLTLDEFVQLFPKDQIVKTKRIYLCGITSNLVTYTP